jgi:hypothetical protein
MSNRTATAVVMAILLIVFAGGASASEEASGTVEPPEDVVRQYFEALQAGDYQTCAALIHPDEITPLRELLLSPDYQDALGMLFDTDDPVELAKLSDIELLTRFLEAALGQDPGIEAIIADIRFSIVGVVYEGTHLAHVVYRAIANIYGIAINRADFVTLRRGRDVWQLNSLR